MTPKIINPELSKLKRTLRFQNRLINKIDLKRKKKKAVDNRRFYLANLKCPNQNYLDENYYKINKVVE